MKKYFLLIFVFVISISLVNATTSISGVLSEGETKIYHLSNMDPEITLEIVYKHTHTEVPYYEAYFIIDGRRGGYRQGRSYLFDGVIFEVDEVDFKEPPDISTAKFTISVQEKCGNNICSPGLENCYSCPQDCGCKSGYNCYARKCIGYLPCGGKECDVGCGDGNCDSFFKEVCYEDNCCNGRNINLDNDNNNCGACWNTCKEDYVCEQGECVLNIKDDLSYYPKFLIRNNNLDVTIVVGDKAPPSHVIAQTEIALSLSRKVTTPTSDIAKLASEIDDVDNLNIISIGNACVNEVSAEILGNPEPCKNLEAGEATIEIYKSKGNKAHIILDAYSDEGIKKVAEALSKYHNFNFKGNKFILEVDEKEINEETSKYETIEEEKGEIEEKVTEEEYIEEIEIVKKAEIKEEEKETNKIKEEEIQSNEPEPTIKQEENLINRVILWFFSLFK